MEEFDEQHLDAAALAGLRILHRKDGLHHASLKASLQDTYAVTGPLGLLGFGLPTVLLSFHNVGIYRLNSIIIGMARVYGGLAQFVAGVFELLKGNTFSGIAFVSYACFWWTLLMIWTSEADTGKTEPKVMGVFLLFWCIFTIVMFIGTLKSSWTLRTIFGTLAIALFFLSLGDFTEMEAITRIGGGIGLLCGATATYTGLLEILDHTVGWGHGFY
jgi:succinate-acetate transporter protein